MYITIKNIEALQNHLQKQGKPLKGVVVDLEQVVDKDFTQLFFDACEEYSEAGESKQATESIKPCENCKYYNLELYEEPCSSCFDPRDNYEPAEPNLKEVTERMKSEFDATGKDVRIFMENKNSKKAYAEIEREYVGAYKFKKHFKCPFCKNVTNKPDIHNGAWYKCENCGGHIYIQ